MIDRTSYGETGGGETDGGDAGEKQIELFTLRSECGAFVGVTNYGATVTELHVPDRYGALADVVLGYDTLAEYAEGKAYFGAIVGRVANRIAGGRFELDGRRYQLAANDGANHLHGGVRGFDKVVWEAEPHQTADGPAVRFRYDSPDGEEGYPGRSM